MSRGVLYIVWPGIREHKTQETLARSMNSACFHHPELPIHVHELPKGSDMLDKADMVDFSPFDETLYLDTDTVVLGRLDYGFEKAAQHGVAVCICECPWARRVISMRDMGDIQEYNCGIIFWSRKAEPLMRKYQSLTREIDTTIIHRLDTLELAQLNDNDQAGFALAVEQTGWNPWVLPMNWNYRPKWHGGFFGPLKIWHSYEEVPADILECCAEQSRSDALIQFNSSLGPGACGTPTPSPARPVEVCA